MKETLKLTIDCILLIDAEETDLGTFIGLISTEELALDGYGSMIIF